jgi:hypothetical protein
MSSKAPVILGGLAIAGVAAYFLTRKTAAKTASASAPPTSTSAPPASKPQTATKSIPKVENPTEWTPPVGYPKLPSGWQLPTSIVPPAGWSPPINWQAPAWIEALGWKAGQPIPGIVLPAPAVAPGTPTVQAIAPGPRGAVPVQRAYKLGFDDGQPAAWGLPGVPFSLPNISSVLPGVVAMTPTEAEEPREMGEDDKFALWKSLFHNVSNVLDYCYDPAGGCMQAHAMIGEARKEDDKRVVMAQDIANLNDSTPPRDNYDNPGWMVLYSPSTEVFWLLEEKPALEAVKKDDWVIFLRPNEYHKMQERGGPDYTVPDDLPAAS